MLTVKVGDTVEITRDGCALIQGTRGKVGLIASLPSGKKDILVGIDGGGAAWIPLDAVEVSFSAPTRNG